MKPITKKILITSASLAGPGFMVTEKGITSFSDSQAEPYIMEKTEIEGFERLDIKTYSETDIELLPSGNDRFYIEYTLDGNYAEPVCRVSDGTLTFRQESSGRGGVYLFGFGTTSSSVDPSVRIYVPEGMTLSELSVYCDFGDVTLENITAKQASIYLDYGDLDMSEIFFTDADITLSSGDIKVLSCSADTLNLTNEYGDSTLDQMSVLKADITIEYGDFTLDAYNLEKLTGVNEYGDTSFTLHDPYNSYSYDLATEYGEIKIPDGANGQLLSDADSWEMAYRAEANGTKSIEFTAEDGDIEVVSGL